MYVIYSIGIMNRTMGSYIVSWFPHTIMIIEYSSFQDCIKDFSENAYSYRLYSTQPPSIFFNIEDCLNYFKNEIVNIVQYKLICNIEDSRFIGFYKNYKDLI